MKGFLWPLVIDHVVPGGAVQGSAFQPLAADDIGFNRYTITNLHGLLANNLLPDEAAPGRLRFQPAGIGLSVYTPTAIPQLIAELFDKI